MRNSYRLLNSMCISFSCDIQPATVFHYHNTLLLTLGSPVMLACIRICLKMRARTSGNGIKTPFTAKIRGSAPNIQRKSLKRGLNSGTVKRGLIE